LYGREFARTTITQGYQWKIFEEVSSKYFLAKSVGKKPLATIVK
jgi:hypothetical protein